MKEHLLQIVSPVSPEQQLNVAREYLQVYMLRLMHEAGAYSSDLSFVGGTALRLLHQLPRFSEDIDFSATPNTKTPIDLKKLFKRMKANLEKAGYSVTAKMNTDRTVANAFFRFEGLPREIGWSQDPRLSLAIKIEIDLNPPKGANIETTLIHRFFPIAIRHYDLPSLFAGKLHALLTRNWVKGRDWFDLVWFLSDKHCMEPNFMLLKNALAQTKIAKIDAKNWRKALRKRLRSLDWKEVIADLRAFVERQSDLDHLAPELVEKLL